MTTPTRVAHKANHPWSRDALLAKAQRYAQEMISHPRDDWRFGLNSTFVLECVARAALSNISPTLLADPKDWSNLYYSLGHAPTASKFIPRSIATNLVLQRLREAIPGFTSEMEGQAAKHINRRNEELHTGGTPFDGLESSWLAPFYEAIGVLMASMNEELVLLVGKDEESIAAQLIAAAHDESAKAVAKSIAAHAMVWQSKDPKDQKKLVLQSSSWATRQVGHRVACPACENDAIVVGAPIAAPLRKLDGDMIVEVQEYLPSKFECVACQLKIAGLSQLSACGLGSAYRMTSTFDAADYYTIQDEFRGFEDDNNEPG